MIARESPPIDAREVAAVLAEIAHISSETLELHEVFDRVAASVRRVIPFENMGVVRFVEGQGLVLHATTLATKDECFDAMPLSAWSPRWRPGFETRRIDDAAVELDRSYSLDAEVLDAGVRSTLWEPFRQGDGSLGGVWLCTTEPHAFEERHEEALRPIAALLGVTVEHWRLWDAERRRRERVDRVELLLSTLAESLDVRAVFGRLSAEMQPILEHDLMVLTELDLKTRTMRVAAHASQPALDVPLEPVVLTEKEIEQRIDFEIIQDMPAEIAPDTERKRLLLQSGMRSWLRVPVVLSGEIKGGLSFFHTEPSRYGCEDAEVARRLADRIALTLSMRQLADEERLAAEVRERADRLEATVETLARELAQRERGRIVGTSPSWRESLRAVGRVAPSETTVLITGESGTGKEVISKLVHQGSSRSDRPFVAINCAALPEQLLESELFGHERGAFTGAIATKIGRIEQAEGGTLFLDEIGEMSPQVQAKFLRVLEEREFQRLGGTRTIRANVRVVAATNRDLPAAITRGTFREDLYYRLNVFAIHVAPLRERSQDILPLAEAFVQDLGRTMGRPAAGISRDARDWLETYAWPGNVRELRNAIERAILMCDGGLITRDHLPAPIPRPEPTPALVLVHAAAAANGTAPVNGTAVEDVNHGAMERSLLMRAMEQAKGNKSKAARLLGLSRAQLYWRLEKYGID